MLGSSETNGVETAMLLRERRARRGAVNNILVSTASKNGGKFFNDGELKVKN